MTGEYARTVRAMQAATRNVDRSFSDVTEGYRVVAADGTVLLPFTGSRSRARRMELANAGSTVEEVTR